MIGGLSEPLSGTFEIYFKPKAQHATTGTELARDWPDF